MKKVYLTLIVMMLATAAAMAQAQIGIRAGLNVASISDNFEVQDADQPWRTGFNVGIATQFRTSEVFSIAPELIYEQRGYRVVSTIDDGEAIATFNYLSLPLMFRLHFGDILKGYVNAGPTFSYWLGGRQSSTVPGLFDVEFEDEKVILEGDVDEGPWGYSNANRLEIGAAIGGGIMLDTEGGTFLIDLRYVQGFTDMATVPNLNNFRNRVVSVSLMYLIPSVRGMARPAPGTGF